MSADAPEGERSEEAWQREIEELKAKIARLEGQAPPVAAKKASTRKTARNAKPESIVHTSGGAGVGGSVEVANGHFIGRDFVQVIESLIVQSDDAEHAKLALASYLHALATELAGLRLGDIDASPDQTRQKPLELADIYVPLDTTFRLPKGVRLEVAAHAREPGELLLHAKGRRGEPQEMRVASAIEALATHPRLTLLGAPGSGKSTFGNFVLLALAQAWQGRAKAPEQLGKAWTAGPLLPVRVVLRRFAERHARTEEALHAGHLWSFIGEDLHAGGWGDARDAMKTVQRLALKHGALVLFDGLDECGDEARRQRVLAAVQKFMESAGAQSRFLLTARPYAFPLGADPAQGIYRLADLDEPKIEAFIKAWYQALVRRGWQQEAPARRKRDDLLAAYARPDLLPLAANPLLLTLMATLHSNRGRLPDDRVDLYDDTVTLLLQRWNKDVGADRALLEALAIPTLTLAHLRGVLERVAYEAHESSVGTESAAEIGEDRLVRAFTPLLQGSKDKATQVVEFIERRAGLLLGLGTRDGGERQFGFPHRTFQEFLAACHLQARSDFARECRRLAEEDAGHWRVVLVLAARLAKAERGASAADELIGGHDAQMAVRAGQRPTPADWTRVLTAALQLQEIGPGPLAAGHATQAVLARVQGWLQAGLPLHPSEGGVPARQRAALGDVLAALGDPRFDPNRLHLPADDMLGFMRIEADPDFRIGTRSADRERVARVIGGDADDDEINDEPTPTPAFYIARYPVTVAQFRTYIEVTGRELEDPGALRDAANRPVCFVSWNEAIAYCDWLHERLLHEPALADSGAYELVGRRGWRVSLPSELEWEKAARGGHVGQVFSWGDEPDPERANVNSSDIGGTCAVGCFPPNGFGLHDMLGNVWEWTYSLENAADGASNAYPCRAGDPRFEALSGSQEIRRLVRGGSWGFTHGSARCAYRDGSRPGLRVNFLGFRVVLRSAPVLER